MKIKIFILAFISSLFFAQTASPQNQHFWAAYSKNTAGTPQIYISKCENGKWNEKFQITKSSKYNISPSIAIDKDKNIWVVWCGFDNISTSIYAVKFSNGKIENEYQISLPDKYEDSQPSIDIGEDGYPIVVWSAYDGKDDEIMISYYNGSDWTIEKIVNQPNDVPDIDPSIICLKDKIVVFWSSFKNGSYKIISAFKTKDKDFQIQDIELGNRVLSESFPMAIKNDKIKLFFIKGNTPAMALLSNESLKTLKTFPKNKPEDLLNKIKNLNEKYINLSLAFTKNNKNITVNLTPFLNTNTYKTKNYSFLSILLHKLKSFFGDREIYAVIANKNTAFGDSITYGYKSETGGYPARLANLLGETVVNRGVGGENTAHGLNRINSVLSTDDPQRIIIMEGTNDMNQGRSISSTIYNLKEMVRRSQAHGSTPYLCTICPSDRQPTRTAQLNAEIRNAAVELGVKNPDIDAAFGGKVSSTYFFDDIHPNDTGYDKIAQTIYNTIRPSSDSGGGDGGCGTITAKGNGINLSAIFFIIIFIFVRNLLRIKSKN